MFDRWLVRPAALGVVLLPAGILAWTILVYGVNVPYWDQWEVANLIVQAFDGRLSLADLTAQQNESRLAFPRLLFIGLAYLTGYDVRYEMWGSFCLACLVVYNIYRLGRVTLRGDRRQEMGLLTVASALTCSLVQWENWFWGIQLIIFVPIACTTSIISLAYSSLSARAKFAASAVLATLSTFSYANGLSCWIIVLPVLILRTWEELKIQRWLLGCWGVGFVLNVGLYFWNYVPPPHHPSFTEALMKPLAAGAYFVAFLGAPLRWGTPLHAAYQAAGVGCGIGMLFVLACGYVWRHRHEPLVLYRTVGWLTLGSYTLVSAGVTTLGRLGLGLGTALSSRYGAFEFPLIVSIVYLVPIVLDRYGQARLPQRKLWIMHSSTALSAVLILLHFFTTARAFAEVESHWRRRLQGKAMLSFIRLLPQEALMHTMYPDIGTLKHYAEGLDRHGLLSPGLRKDLSITHDERHQMTRVGECGWFDLLQHTGGEHYIAHGWAIVAYHQRPADAVILAYAESDGSFTIFDLAAERTPRIDVAQALRQRRYMHTGWAHTFKLPQIDRNPIKIAAWALDANTGQLCQLRTAYMVDAQAAEMHAVEPQ